MTLTKVIDMQQGRNYVWFGTLVFTGADTYVTGGMTLNFNLPSANAKAVRKPMIVWFNSAGSGYDYYYVPGTSAQNGLIKIIGSGTASGGAKGEIAAATVPAAIQSDTITVEAHFFGVM